MSVTSVLLPFVGVVVGAAIGRNSSFRTARFNAKHEHDHWLRAERMKTYVEFGSLIEEVTDISFDDRFPNIPSNEIDRLHGRVGLAVISLSIIGPPSLRETYLPLITGLQKLLKLIAHPDDFNPDTAGVILNDYADLVDAFTVDAASILGSDGDPRFHRDSMKDRTKRWMVEHTPRFILKWWTQYHPGS